MQCPVDAVTYWIAPQLKTPVKINQSMASVPPFIEKELFLLSCQRLPPPPPPLFTSVPLTLLIPMQTKDNYQLRFTCAVDLTCKGLLISLNECICGFLWSKATWEENVDEGQVAFVVPVCRGSGVISCFR